MSIWRRPIEAELYGHLTDVNGCAVESTTATLLYRPEDPYAVHFRPTSRQPGNWWAFARELLRDGLHAPTGHSDVVITPAGLSGAGRLILVKLSSPDGRAVLQLSHRAAAEFLRRTYVAVPDGAEQVDSDPAALLTSWRGGTP